tara:strand:- start:684 stop:968 length:285 start_codon:yes stop_codon:yes gene_type:complete
VFSGVAGSNSDSNLEYYPLPVSGNTIDIDSNVKFDALTDGLLLPRSLFELSGTPLISGVVANDAVYKSSGEGEFLTIIQNVRLGSVDDNDFSAI